MRRAWRFRGVGWGLGVCSTRAAVEDFLMRAPASWNPQQRSAFCHPTLPIHSGTLGRGQQIQFLAAFFADFIGARRSWRLE